MKIKKELKSDFSKNFLTLLTGTTIAQALPIAFSPILARIYTPEDFGLSAIFFAIIAIISVFSTGKYELAIIIPVKKEDAINIFFLGFILLSIISLISLVIIIIFNSHITQIIGIEEISQWLYFIPFAVFLTGIFNLLNFYNTRLKKYKDISKSLVIKSFISSVTQLTIGFLRDGVLGLIVGQLFSQFFANLKLAKNIFNDKELIKKVSKNKIISLAIKYKKFLKFSTIASFLNTSSQQIISVLIPTFFNTATLGFYAMGQRVLSIPTTIIGTSIGQVFLQEAQDEKMKTGFSRFIFLSTLRKLLLIGIPMFIFIFIFIEDLFVFVFGENWAFSGLYAKILVPLFFFRFISSALSPVLIVFEKQKSELLINTILFLSSIIVINIFDDFIGFLQMFTLVMSLNYTLFLVYYYYLSSRKN